ncbi:DUF6479 family protein [Streptomyces sp. NBC_01764]|uniref:DUF6479 family protein n=1 Tax=Streptomyces sp. NBC_01764 TaxID=2975935 RepID=UPI0022543FD3|nr:DUF6479 family protein [Streptomyces sp. NBC_01764]MCX4404082.1 DUF6479 family protein [Streptomyces sp. NBC_01764]
MNPTDWQIAVSNVAYGTLGAFLGGLVIAGALVWAVRLGIRVRRQEPSPPKAHEHPQLPDSGPVRETREIREPDEVPLAAGESERLAPHELHNSGSKRSDKQERSRWGSGSSGSFGSGGPGRT